MSFSDQKRWSIDEIRRNLKIDRDNPLPCVGWLRNMIEELCDRLEREQTTHLELRAEMEAAFIAMDPETPRQMSLSERAGQLRAEVERLQVELEGSDEEWPRIEAPKKNGWGL